MLCQLSYRRTKKVVRSEGIEPSRPFGHRPLKPARAANYATSAEKWWGRRASNPQRAEAHRFLRPACLPNSTTSPKVVGEEGIEPPTVTRTPGLQPGTAFQQHDTRPRWSPGWESNPQRPEGHPRLRRACRQLHHRARRTKCDVKDADPETRNALSVSREGVALRRQMALRGRSPPGAQPKAERRIGQRERQADHRR